jgi:N-acetyl-alpha-D-muramate 1-phosphate uridylyltransferase
MSRPTTAMVLAAGFGTRMRPITDTIPKPLVEVCGRSLIDHAIDRLEAAGVEHVVVNTHYRGAQIAAHLAKRPSPRITISEESEILETGGGVVKALPLLGERFYVVNSDVLWLDGKVPALERLARAWHEDDADALLLLQRTATAFGYEGVGDYFVDPLGVPRLRREREIAPNIFAGIQILHRRLFATAHETLPSKFSLLRLYNRAQDAGRLRAIVHDGEWYHIGTPQGLTFAEERLAIDRVAR